jgi:hypothetical protein
MTGIEGFLCIVLAGMVATGIADVFDFRVRGNLPADGRANTLAIGIAAIAMIAYLALVMEYAEEALTALEGLIGEMTPWKWVGLFCVTFIATKLVSGLSVLALSRSRRS